MYGRSPYVLFQDTLRRDCTPGCDRFGAHACRTAIAASTLLAHRFRIPREGATRSAQVMVTQSTANHATRDLSYFYRGTLRG